LGTELIVFGGFLDGLIDAIAWLFNPANWWIILQVAAGLGFVIFVHELGHFLVAKACGVKCEKFYIGFDINGLKLAKFQWGETEYGIGILPLGGYVKMLGQDDNPYRAADEMKRARGEGAALEDAAAGGTAGDAIARGKMIAFGRALGAEGADTPRHPLPSGDLPPEPSSEPHLPYDPRSYMAQSVPERMAIISAGVIMNVIFAFIMAAWAYGLGVKELPCRISQVFSGGAAWEAGLETGDEVVQIGDLEDPIYEDLRMRVPLSDLEQGVDFVVRREGYAQLIDRTLQPTTDFGIPLIGVDGPRKLEVAHVIEFSTADRSEPLLLPGDRIVEVSGARVSSIKDWQRELVRRQNEPLELTIVPASRNFSDAADQSAKNTDQSSIAAEVPTPIVITVPVSRRRVLGLVLEMGPIVAVQKESPADQAGLKANDRVLSINGQPVGDPLTLPDRITVAAQGKDDVTLRIRRDSKEIELQVQPREVTWIEDAGPMGRISLPALGIAYQVTATVESVAADGPAGKAGIKKGDVLQSAQLRLPPSLLEPNPNLRQTEPIPISDGQLNHWPAVVEGLQTHHPRGTVVLEYLRGEERRRAELEAIESTEFFNAERGIVLALDHRIREVNDIGEAAKLGFRKTVDSLLMVYRFLQRVSQAQISPKMLGGPVTIARFAGKSAEEGFPALLMFLTMLSANLAVVNFLPIPVLDGGHMVFLIYEGITGKPPSERVFVLLSYLGLAFILSLMIFVLGLDFGFISRR